MRSLHILLAAAGFGFVASASATEGPISIPKELGRPVALKEYLALALDMSLQRKSADMAKKNAERDRSQHYDNYLPRPTVTASQSTNASSGSDSQSVSRSQSAGLAWAGQSPYGISWGVSAPEFSKSKNETGGDFSSVSETHTARFGANVSIDLLRDSYFVVGTRNDTRADLTYKNAILSYQSSMLEIVKNAQSRFFDVIFKFTALQIKKDAVSDAKKLLEDTKIKQKEGEVDQLAVLQSRLQLVQAENSLITSEEDFQKSYEDFIQIIDPDRKGGNLVFPDPAVLAQAPKGPEISLDDALKMAIAKQPQYNISRNNFYLQKIGLTQSRSALWPSLQLTSNYGWSGSDQGGWEALAKARRGDQKSVTVGLSFSYVPWNNPAVANYQSALSQYRQSENEFNKKKQELATSLSSQLKSVDNAFRRLKTSDLTLELSREKLKAEKFKFDEGVATIQNVIDFQKEYEQARIDVMQARSHVYQAITDLKATLGVSHTEIGNLD